MNFLTLYQKGKTLQQIIILIKKQMSSRNIQCQTTKNFSYNSINNGQSFYENLQEHESCSQIIMIDKQYDGIETLLNRGEGLLVEQQYVTIDQNTQKYYIMYLTNYRIVIDKKPAISIPYGYIQQFKTLEKCLRIILKTGIYFDFCLDFTNQNHSFASIQESIISGIANLPFCLNFLSENIQCPNLYDSYAQIQRMKVDSKHFSVFKNASGKFCSTYPLYFLIPKGIQISNLNQVKKCRYYSRIPVMSFYNEKSGTGLWRSAKRKHQINEDILKTISGTVVTIQLEENKDFQSLTSLKLNFINLTKLYSQNLQGFQSTKLDLFKALGRWYQQIDKILNTAYNAVSIINSGKHVIVQEIYALDRASQILVVASIIMDPFFRTFEGLSILIEKQFVSYGHPFEDRGGFNKNKQYEASPVLIQVLECIHQLIVTNPSCFQYSSSHVAQIAFEVYTTRYKNFINKSNNPRRQKEYNHCPINMWQDISKRRSHFNFHYDSKSTRKQLWEIRKKPCVKEYIIWIQYFDMICKMQGQVQSKQSIKSWEKFSPVVKLTKRGQ